MSRFVWHAGDWLDLATLPPRPPPKAPMIIRDVQPYRSTITGEVIGSRSHHREHLRAHGCIEVGNEPIRDRAPLESPPGLGEDIARAYDQLS